MKTRIKYLIGIDEAGRGPLAGPVAVGVFCVPKECGHSVSTLFGDGVVRDSKKLTPVAREKIFQALVSEKRLGRILYAVAFASAPFIDRNGISRAIRTALCRSLDSLKVPARECRVLLDGGLRAPEKFTRQKTIIKGDEKEAVIALASIIAKVSRDRKMILFSKKYPQYGFEKHKGYGTRLHYARLRAHGLSKIHRRSFLKNLPL